MQTAFSFVSYSESWWCWWPSEACSGALTGWWDLGSRKYAPLQWLYWRSQILVFTRK